MKSKKVVKEDIVGKMMYAMSSPAVSRARFKRISKLVRAFLRPRKLTAGQVGTVRDKAVHTRLLTHFRWKPKHVVVNCMRLMFAADLKLMSTSRWALRLRKTFERAWRWLWRCGA